MIVSNIIGGLGNQMFQYATAYALSKRLGVDCKLDISEFDAYGLHNGFELQRVFNCKLEVASQAEIRRILDWQAFRFVRYVLNKPLFRFARKRNLIVEPGFNFWAGINSVPENSYLQGYWQSEQYFNDIPTQIRSEFSFKQPLDAKNQDLAEQISNSNAVSLHIRRGDYVSNKKNTAIYEACSPKYFEDAINYVGSLIQHPVLYIFSDDMAWVKSNLKLSYPHVYVDHNKGVNSYIDMWLMSLCKHNIIANSSFSWWGAWLNSNVDKIIVAPKRWFSNKTDVTDLLPCSWIRM